jgi:fructoselysine-6-P-deglycase FrlB-like protein
MVKLDPVLLKKNQHSEISSYLIAADEIEKSLGRNREELARLARFLKDYAPDRILLLASGASWVTLYTGFNFLQTCTSLGVTHRYGPEFLVDEPREHAKARTVAILASYSGNTADTVNAARACKERGYPTIAICRARKGKLLEHADHLITYESVCLYTSAMANLLWLLAEYAELRGERAEGSRMKKELEQLPGKFRACLARSEEVAAEAIERLKDDTFFYVLGDGAVWGLAYQYGYTNLMEYAKIHAACLRSSEWRHGPLEVLPSSPAMVQFVGTDPSREYSLATQAYCRSRGARLAVFDSKDYFDTHPVLAPFALHTVSQLFLISYCTLHGRDMDAYGEMHIRPYLPGETYF